MALIANSNVLETVFTPGAGTFAPSVSNGFAILHRQLATGEPFTVVGQIGQGDSFVVDNPQGGTNYLWRAVAGSTPRVAAYQ
jgi:sortase (surface protein transpeptidase)